MATLCFCPPDSCVPFSPIRVSYPCGHTGPVRSYYKGSWQLL
jgi:hypothetical protein